MSTIYEQLGGRDAVKVAVDKFYERMLADERVSYFFDDVDMNRQKGKQTGFLIMVLGGPNNYDGQDMREGHKHLLERGLNDTHVDIVIEHLGATLAELGANEEQIQEVAKLANSVRDDVLNR